LFNLTKQDRHKNVTVNNIDKFHTTVRFAIDYSYRHFSSLRPQSSVGITVVYVSVVVHSRQPAISLKRAKTFRDLLLTA